MLNLNMLEHQLPGEPKLDERLAEVGARFSAIAENIAIGANPQIIHAGWMKSPDHRKNILDLRFNSVGIAAVHGPGGLFAVQDFSQSVPELNVEQQEQKVAALLATLGLRSATATHGARRPCDNDAAFAGTSARAMIRFEAPAVTTLA